MGVALYIQGKRDEDVAHDGSDNTNDGGPFPDLGAGVPIEADFGQDMYHGDMRVDREDGEVDRKICISVVPGLDLSSCIIMHVRGREHRPEYSIKYATIPGVLFRTP